MAEDNADLQRLLSESLSGARVVTCPGNIQSPGPWRRNASPTRVAGTLACAVRPDDATGRNPAGTPVIAWTTDAQHLVSVIEADTQGPSMAQLYAWWTAHS